MYIFVERLHNEYNNAYLFNKWYFRNFVANSLLHLQTRDKTNKHCHNDMAINNWYDNIY